MTTSGIANGFAQAFAKIGLETDATKKKREELGKFGATMQLIAVAGLISSVVLTVFALLLSSLILTASLVGLALGVGVLSLDLYSVASKAQEIANDPAKYARYGNEQEIDVEKVRKEVFKSTFVLGSLLSFFNIA